MTTTTRTFRSRLLILERSKPGRIRQQQRQTSSYVSINGRRVVDGSDSSAPATISVFDTSFHRGDGVFEVMKLIPDDNNNNNNDASIKIRSLDRHLQRLDISAQAVGCPLPNPETLTQWLQEAANTVAVDDKNNNNSKDDAKIFCIRLIATKGGGNNNNSNIEPSVIISLQSIQPWPKTFQLMPLHAPWHCAGAPGWEIPIKWTSYGPNVVSTQKAQANGFTDALLLSNDRLVVDNTTNSSSSNNNDINDFHVLDGPNFAISWIKDNTLHVPCTQTLGLLPSITQEMIMDLAESKLKFQVQKGVFSLSQVLDAEEAFVCSTTRGVIPVSQIGSHSFVSEKNKNHELFPIAMQLSELLDQTVTE